MKRRIWNEHTSQIPSWIIVIEMQLNSFFVVIVRVAWSCDHLHDTATTRQHIRNYNSRNLIWMNKWNFSLKAPKQLFVFVFVAIVSWHDLQTVAWELVLFSSMLECVCVRRLPRLQFESSLSGLLIFAVSLCRQTQQSRISEEIITCRIFGQHLAIMSNDYAFNAYNV